MYSKKIFFFSKAEVIKQGEVEYYKIIHKRDYPRIADILLFMALKKQSTMSSSLQVSEFC